MTIALLPDLRQGTVYSNAVAWEAGKTGVTAQSLLSDDVAADPLKNFVMCLEGSFDGGLTFSGGAKAPWVGGTLAHDGVHFVLPLLGQNYTLSQMPPTHVRVRFELTSPISVGATVTFS